jgi:hypothetical protein
MSDGVRKTQETPETRNGNVYKGKCGIDKTEMLSDINWNGGMV